MTEQEAIEDIEKNILPSVGGISLKMAIGALEKQMPRRIKVINSIHYYCPSCDLYFDSRDWKSKYCGRCGQAIKWG